jgi:carboxyl-terminal processing protease
MLPACHKATGANVHFPDVCLTPPVPPLPKPYTNTAMNMTSVAFVPNVLISGAPAHNVGTINAKSIGDELGTLHWTIKGPSFYVSGSPIVTVGKLPGTNLTNPTIGNTGNAPLGFVKIPSISNVRYTLRGAEDDHREARRLALDLAREVALTGEGREIVSSEVMEDGVTGARLGVVRIALFAASAPNLFRSVLRRFEADGVDVLMIDLRDCRGGDLDAALRVAEELLPNGASLARIVDAEGDEDVPSSRNNRPSDLPVIVWVNEGTASAAEILTAALKDHSRALIIGARTYGKGSAASFVAEGYRTTHQVCGPTCTVIDGAGIEPDIPL